MTQQARLLRHKIALYRDYLADGVDADLAKQHLHEIQRLESELARIERDGDKRD